MTQLIKCSERLPSYETPVLIFLNYSYEEVLIGEIWKDWLLDDNGEPIDFWHINNFIDLSNPQPTHWQPLPSPPEDE